MKKFVCLLLFVLIISSLGVVSEDAVSPTIEITIGDYFSFGTYSGSPILWRCVDIDENGVLLLSDKALCKKAFDGAGNVTTQSHGHVSGRTESGSNYWGDSNLRAWLNSDEAAGEVVWSCGNAPTSSNVISNAYNNEAGFLNGFSADEKNLIKEVQLKNLLFKTEYDNMSQYGTAAHTYKSSLVREATTFALQNYETAYSENLTEKMFLLDVKQAIAVYENFSNNYIVAKDMNGSNVTTWLRTPAATLNGGIYTRTISTSATVSHHHGKYGENGVRPAFYLKDTAVIDEGSGTISSPYTVISAQNTGSIQLSAKLPAHNGDTSAMVITTIRSSLGMITKVNLNSITVSQTTTTPVTITIPNTDFTAGNYLDVYVWDDDLKPVIADEHYMFAVVGGNPTLISTD